MGKITMSKNAVVVEHNTIERDYGMTGNELIIDVKGEGRFLLVDGFGGIDTIDGGAVRFKHGLICKLKASDTFETLAENWNDHTLTKDAVLNGYDKNRPILNWSGFMVDRLARSVIGY